MCLPVNPYKIEREWEYKGLKCAVVQAREASHRCGYVRVPPTHPLHGKGYDDVEVAIHGGLTFAELEPCAHEDGAGWWFGFDCAHCHDASYDPNIPIEQVSPDMRSIVESSRRFEREIAKHGMNEHYWLEAEVVAETERLADQLLEDS